MQFTFLAMSTLLTLTTAVHIRAFTKNNCLGTQWVCYNIPAGTCCQFPVDFCSMSWTFPTHSRGTAYMFDHCWWPFDSVYGIRTNSCWNYRGTWQPSSAKWTNTPAKRDLTDKRQDGQCIDCVEPDLLVYTTGDGKTRIIDVPAGEATKVAEYVTRENWKALESYQDSKKEIDLEEPAEYGEIEAPKDADKTGQE